MADNNDHSISWWITKPTPKFTLSAESVSLQDLGDQKNSTVVVTHDGNGKITAISEDLNIASTSVNSNNINITRTGKGSTKIFVMLGSDTSYSVPAAKHISVSCGESITLVDKPKPSKTSFEYSGSAVKDIANLTGNWIVTTINSSGTTVASPTDVGAYTSTFKLNSGSLWNDSNPNSDDYSIAWKITQASCDLVVSETTNSTTYVCDGTSTFKVTRKGSADITFNVSNAADSSKVTITNSTITGGKQFSVKWKSTGTIKLQAAVAEFQNYKSATQEVSRTIRAKSPNLKVNDVTVTALASKNVTVTCSGGGQIKITPVGVASQYVTVASSTTTIFTFSGTKTTPTDGVQFKATIDAYGDYASDSCTFKVFVTSATRTVTVENITATWSNDWQSQNPTFEPKITVSAGSYIIRNAVSTNPYVLSGYAGSTTIFTEMDTTAHTFGGFVGKTGSTTVAFDIYDPNEVYEKVRRTITLTINKAERVVQNPVDVQVNENEGWSVWYSFTFDGDGNISFAENEKLKAEVSGKQVRFQVTDSPIRGRDATSTAVTCTFSIAENDYYQKYDGDISIFVYKGKTIPQFTVTLQLTTNVNKIYSAAVGNVQVLIPKKTGVTYQIFIYEAKTGASLSIDSIDFEDDGLGGATLNGDKLTINNVDWYGALRIYSQETSDYYGAERYVKISQSGSVT